MGKLKKASKSENIDSVWSEQALKTEEVPSKKPKSKRKSELEETNSKKKRKKDSGCNEPLKEDKFNDDEEIQEPTLDLLKESEKPEYNLAVKSGRRKKKEKHKQILIEKKTELASKDVQKNHEYLKQWKNNRNEWKFQKLRQISIQLSMFDEKKLNKKLWPNALEYLSTTKGQSKVKIIEIAEKQLNDLDKEIELTQNNGLVKNYKYCRARELLQSFD